MADQGGTFNPQQQFPVSWPDHPVVALAYLDQLTREGAIGDEPAQGLYQALERAAEHVDAGTRDRDLAGDLRRLARELPDMADGSETARAPHRPARHAGRGAPSGALAVISHKVVHPD